MAILTRNTRARSLAHTLALSLALLVSPWASAQTELPAAVVQSTTLNDAQRQEAARYAQSGLALLRSAQWSEARRGRDQLLRPLEDSQTASSVSVAFRLEYARELVPTLSTLAGRDQSDLTRLNAIRLLGAIATAQSAAAIEPLLADASPAVRFMACQAAGTTFRALATSSPALPSGEALRLVNRLASLATSEKDPTVVDSAVTALVDASKVEIANYTEVREGAFQQIARSMSARIQALPTDSLDEATLATVLRAGVAARDGLIGRTRLSASLNRELAAFGGDLVAYVRTRLKAGHMPPPGSGMLRSALEQLASTGEANVFYALLALDVSRDPTSVSAVLQDGNAQSDAQFIQQAEAFIKDTLVARPLSFPAERFIK